MNDQFVAKVKSYKAIKWQGKRKQQQMSLKLNR